MHNIIVYYYIYTQEKWAIRVDTKKAESQFDPLQERYICYLEECAIIVSMTAYIFSRSLAGSFEILSENRELLTA